METIGKKDGTEGEVKFLKRVNTRIREMQASNPDVDAAYIHALGIVFSAEIRVVLDPSSRDISPRIERFTRGDLHELDRRGHEREAPSRSHGRDR